MLGGAAAILSLVFGTAAGASADRSVSLGLYGVGSFLLLAGFVIGSRGPARLERGLRLRFANTRERESTVNAAAVFVAVGFVLIVLGLAVDSRVRLV